MAALSTFIGKVVVQIINPIILLLAGAAFVLFVWGGFQFVLNAGDDTKRAEGRSALLWGLIGLVIIFGAYKIIDLAINSFNLHPNDQTTVKGVLAPLHSNSGTQGPQYFDP